MNPPKVITTEDGLDIIVSEPAWYCKVISEGEHGEYTRIVFRKSNGNNPLRIKDITGIDFGDLDQPLGIDYKQ